MEAELWPVGESHAPPLMEILPDSRELVSKCRASLHLFRSASEYAAKSFIWGIKAVKVGAISPSGVMATEAW